MANFDESESETVDLAAFEAQFFNTGEAAVPNTKETAAINENINSNDDQPTAEVWYTKNGTRLPGKPTKPGMYICNRRMVAIR